MPQQTKCWFGIAQGAEATHTGTLTSCQHKQSCTLPGHPYQSGWPDLICHAQECDAISDNYVEKMPLLRIGHSAARQAGSQ